MAAPFTIADIVLVMTVDDIHIEDFQRLNISRLTFLFRWIIAYPGSKILHANNLLGRF